MPSWFMPAWRAWSAADWLASGRNAGAPGSIGSPQAFTTCELVAGRHHHGVGARHRHLGEAQQRTGRASRPTAARWSGTPPAGPAGSRRRCRRETRAGPAGRRSPGRTTGPGCRLGGAMSSGRLLVLVLYPSWAPRGEAPDGGPVSLQSTPNCNFSPTCRCSWTRCGVPRCCSALGAGRSGELRGRSRATPRARATRRSPGGLRPPGPGRGRPRTARRWTPPVGGVQAGGTTRAAAAGGAHAAGVGGHPVPGAGDVRSDPAAADLAPGRGGALDGQEPDPDRPRAVPAAAAGGRRRGGRVPAAGRRAFVPGAAAAAPGPGARAGPAGRGAAAAGQGAPAPAGRRPPAGVGRGGGARPGAGGRRRAGRRRAGRQRPGAASGDRQPAVRAPLAAGARATCCCASRRSGRTRRRPTGGRSGIWQSHRLVFSPEEREAGAGRLRGGGDRGGRSAAGAGARARAGAVDRRGAAGGRGRRGVRRRGERGAAARGRPGRAAVPGGEAGRSGVDGEQRRAGAPEGRQAPGPAHHVAGGDLPAARRSFAR